MTPAAALTQAAMDVAPAYAAEGDPNGSKEKPFALSDETNLSSKGPGTPGEGDPQAGWSDVTVEEGAFAPAVYDGSEHVPAKPTIKVKYTYYTGDTSEKHEEWYVLDAEQITPTYKKGTVNEPSPTAAGSYTATYRATTTDTTNTVNSVKSAVASINDSNAVKNLVQPFTINKATATVTLPEGIVGVDTPNSLTAAVRTGAVTPDGAAAVSITYSSFNNSDVSLTGATTNGSAKYITEGRAKVDIVVTNENANNYKYMVGGTELTDGVPGDENTTFTTDVAIENASKYDVTLTSQTTPGKIINAVDNRKALEAPYTGASLQGTIEPAIDVKAGGKEVDETLVYLDANGQAMVDSQGNQEYPTMPGKYQVQVKVGDQVVQTVPLTVYVDLTSMVNLGEDAGKVMSLTIDGRPTDEVKLAFKDNIAFADVKSQIEGGAVATLKKGDTTVPVDFAETFEVIDGTLATTAGAAGTAYIKPLSSNGVYRGQLPVKYTYGTLLPKASLKNASEPYNGSNAAPTDRNGYKVEELVSVAKDVNGNTLSPDGPAAGYTVTATRTVDGEPEVKTGDDFITEVGTYTVVVEGAGSYVGESEEMTFTITPLTLKFGANGNATVTYADLATPASGGFSATYTGDQITPKPTVKVKFPGGDVPLRLQDPYDKKAPYDYTAAYGDNTTVAEGGTVDLAFSGNYAYDGTYSQAFAITPASLADAGAEATAASQLKSEFDNTVEGLTVELPDGTVLEEGVDYTVSAPTKASSQTDAPAGCTKYEFTVTGKGNYSDSATSILNGSFFVTDKSIEGVFDASVAEGSMYSPYGSATPEVTVYQKGTKTEVTDGFAVSYRDNENATTEGAPAYAVITGTGQYAGSIEVPFQIAPLELSDVSNVRGSVKLDGAEGLVYNGKEQAPQVLVKGSYITPVNEDYDGYPIPLSLAIDQLDVKSEGGVDAGTSYMVIAPKTGNFTGQVKVPYEIAKADVAKAEIEPAAVVPGADLADAVKVVYEGMELVPGTDYTVAAEGALPGKVTATVAGAGKNFTGTATEEIEVLYDLSGVTFEVAQTTYNGKAQAPVVTAAYYMDGGKKVPVDASAYDVKAGSYVNAGTYPIAIAGDAAAGWGGEKALEYTIAPATVTAKPQVSYDAAGLPVVTVPGLTSSDFTYKADAATKTITVTYKGNYKGTATVAYAPTAKPVAPAKPAAGKTGWVGSGNDWAYYEDGKAVKGQWKWIGGEWYHFEKSGKMTNTKWFQDADGTWYMLNQSHKGSYGAMLTGWQKVGKDWYYMNKSGAMQSGWAKVKGEWYLLNAKHDGTFGKMLTGWQQVGGKWYYFNKSGAMQSGWAKVNGEWYLLNSKHDGTFGAMLTGWQKVGGKWYYMDASGAMAENEWVGRYWVNGSGVWTATR